MTENINFNNALERSGLSMYALAKNSGIPYTTVNEIHRGKIDINQCAAGTVCRLAAALGVSANDIINDIYYLAGVKGRHKGIDYTWTEKDGTTWILFEYEGSPVMIDTGAYYNIPARIEYYSIVAGWMIDDHIESIRWQKAVETRFAEAES